ncbi:MAG: hypothetical protein MUE53_09325 [Chitinophagales bacterium]|jgi:hypothetical protein|nr:hypothetical protein [Chitinophagales bacterium]
MEFLEKVEHFISQLQYSLAIEPEPIINYEGVDFNLSLPPHIFFEIVDKFKVDYPFNYQNKIIELKILKRKEDITEKEALDIIQNYVTSYFIDFPSSIQFPQQLYLLLKVREISSEKKTKREKTEKFESVKLNFENEYVEEKVSAPDFLKNSNLFGLMNDFQLIIEGKKNIILKELVEAMKDNQQSEANNESDYTTSDTNLSIREVALLCYYSGKKVTPNNAEEILKSYGHNAYQKLIFHYDLLNKSEIEIINHRFAVKNLENIIPLLQGNAKERAEKDLKSAKNHKNLKK